MLNEIYCIQDANGKDSIIFKQLYEGSIEKLYECFDTAAAKALHLRREVNKNPIIVRDIYVLAINIMINKGNYELLLPLPEIHITNSIIIDMHAVISKERHMHSHIKISKELLEYIDRYNLEITDKTISLIKRKPKNYLANYFLGKDSQKITKYKSFGF